MLKVELERGVEKEEPPDVHVWTEWELSLVLEFGPCSLLRGIIFSPLQFHSLYAESSFSSGSQIGHSQGCILLQAVALYHLVLE